MSLNKIFLIGNMVADPELKQTPNGVPVTSFRIAVNRKFARQGEQQQTDFFDVVCWRQQAEFVCKWFSKGKPILIIGAMQSRTWADQNEQKRYNWEVIADEVTFVERKNDTQPNGNVASSLPEPPAGYPSASVQTTLTSTIPAGNYEEVSPDDELPF